MLLPSSFAVSGAPEEEDDADSLDGDGSNNLDCVGGGCCGSGGENPTTEQANSSRRRA